MKADWQDVFNAQVRAIQAQYPIAHEALRNWGIWSRELSDIPGKTNAITAPGWTAFYKPSGDDYGESEGIETVPQGEVKAEAPELPRSDDRLGQEMDVRLHDLPMIWRRVLKAAYYTLEIPEYEMPRAAKVGYDGFLMFLDGALDHLERAMG